jgi:hypothetical protein
VRGPQRGSPCGGDAVESQRLSASHSRVLDGPVQAAVVTSHPRGYPSALDVGITTGVKLRSPERAQRPRASSASTSEFCSTHRRFPPCQALHRCSDSSALAVQRPAAALLFNETAIAGPGTRNDRCLGRSQQGSEERRSRSALGGADRQSTAHAVTGGHETPGLHGPLPWANPTRQRGTPFHRRFTSEFCSRPRTSIRLRVPRPAASIPHLGPGPAEPT